MKNTVLIIVVIVVAVILGLMFQNKVAFSPTNNENPPPAPTATQPVVGSPVTPTSKVINLSNQALKSIPAYVFNQTGTEELNVSHNLLTGSIPAEIRHLTNLKILNASNNSMTGVPAEVGQLQNLEVLDLSNNQLTGLPNELGNLKNLKTLNLSGNKYSTQDLNGIVKNLPASTTVIK